MRKMPIFSKTFVSNMDKSDQLDLTNLAILQFRIASFNGGS